MEDWDYYYRLQNLEQWWPDMKDGKPDYDMHPNHLAKWDQFTLWWLLEKNPKYKDIKLKYFDEEIRWNFYAIFPESENYTDNPIIVMHYSGQKAGLE